MEEFDYRERLSRDVARWEREGLITAAQSAALLARIGAGKPARIGALRMGWLVTAVSIVGAIVLGAGVVLLVAANWQSMPNWSKTVLILAAMLAAYAIAYMLMYRYRLERIGSAFLLLGTLLFEAGLFLQANIYDLPTESPGYFALAAAGALPLAYLFESRIVLLLAIANASFWVFQSMLGNDPDTQRVLSTLGVVGLYGVGLYATGRIHAVRGPWRHFADVYVLVGGLIALGLVYVFSFHDLWAEIHDAELDSYAAPAVIYVVAAISGALVMMQRLLRGGHREDNIDTAFQAVLVALTALVATWPDWSGWVIVFNIAYFSIVAAIVARGYLRADEPYVNIGLAALALGLLTRYVDVFWPLMARSLFFIIGGLLLLGVAFALERLRRELLRSMEDERSGEPTPIAAQEGRAG